MRRFDQTAGTARRVRCGVAFCLPGQLVLVTCKAEILTASRALATSLLLSRCTAAVRAAAPLSLLLSSCVCSSSVPVRFACHCCLACSATRADLQYNGANACRSTSSIDLFGSMPAWVWIFWESKLGPARHKAGGSAAPPSGAATLSGPPGPRPLGSALPCKERQLLRRVQSCLHITLNQLSRLLMSRVEGRERAGEGTMVGSKRSGSCNRTAGRVRPTHTAAMVVSKQEPC